MEREKGQRRAAHATLPHGALSAGVESTTIMTPFAQHPAVKWLPSVCPESAGRLLCACPALDRERAA